MMAKLMPGLVRWLQRLLGLRGDIRGMMTIRRIAS
jgi:hypothetical protein